MEVTRDERFVTARHSLQSLWKVGLAGKVQQERLLTTLQKLIAEAAVEKNDTLVRYNILAAIRRIFDDDTDRAMIKIIPPMIEFESDPNYRKKYFGVS